MLPKMSNDSVIYFHDTGPVNPSCDVPGGIDHHKLQVTYLKTLNGMAKYEHNKNISSDTDDKTTVSKPNVRNTKKTNVA